MHQARGALTNIPPSIEVCMQTNGTRRRSWDTRNRRVRSRATRTALFLTMGVVLLGISRGGIPYDPKHFGGMKMVREAIRVANQVGKTDDFGIFEFRIPNVHSDGVADLTLGDGTISTYELHSAKLNKLPADIPRGAEVEPKCGVIIVFTAAPEDAEVQGPREVSDCPKPNPPPPKCTLAQIWQRSVAKGAPRDAVATIHYGWEFFDEKVP